MNNPELPDQNPLTAAELAAEFEAQKGLADEANQAAELLEAQLIRGTVIKLAARQAMVHVEVKQPGSIENPQKILDELPALQAGVISELEDLVATRTNQALAEMRANQIELELGLAIDD